MRSFNVVKASTPEVPILISVPHCGTAFPEELTAEYEQGMIQAPDDTDWFVDRLYDFAPAMGMTMISAHFSRWVIDLNRDPESKPLYTDGRIITGLCPVTDFLGKPIYGDHRKEVKPDEVRRRLDLYYWPYHHKLQQLISELKNRFGKVLLWDCHSIRQYVPTIYNEKFPDLILGNADGTAASKELIDTTLQYLRQGDYSVNHNHPFKGGFITRNYGNPAEGFHALQLEMSKVNYMDNTEKTYDVMRAEKMRSLLKTTLAALAETISAS
jgi:N-formylglutamate deformylase